jgi:hypothetical protein
VRCGLHRTKQALAYLESFGPKAAGFMDQVHDLLEGRCKPLKLRILDRKWGRNLQYHEIVAADLAQNSMISKQMHNQHLAKKCWMDLAKRLKGDPQFQRPWWLELDRI